MASISGARERRTSAALAFAVVGVLAFAGCTSSSGDDGDSSGGAAGGSPDPIANGSDPGSPATETNAAPAPCADDTECPPGIACVTSGPGEPGFCDVDEMIAPGDGTAGASSSGDAPVSSAAPAPCTTDADCGPEVKCMHLEGDTGPGFCNVDEMIAPGEGGSGGG